jgi:hypothetical protein
MKSISKIRHIQESNRILENRLLNEQATSAQTTTTGTTPNTQYMAAGTKFCFYGSCRIDIKVIDKTTSQIISSKGSEGGDVNSLYPQVIKQIQDELTAKKITGVTLPTIEQLQDTSPKM